MRETPEYFHLDGPDADRLFASRARGADYSFEPGLCPVDAEHRYEKRTCNLALEVKHNNRNELMISSWLGPRVLHRNVIADLEKHRVTGFRLQQATVQFRDGKVSNDYAELIVTGWAGIARPESGIRLTEECPGCHRREYSSLEDVEQLIDWDKWTGDDLFIVWPLLTFTLITKRAAEVLESAKVKSYRLRSLKHLEQRYIPESLPSLRGFTVSPPSKYMPEDLVSRYGRAAGLE